MRGAHRALGTRTPVVSSRLRSHVATLLRSGARRSGRGASTLLFVKVRRRASRRPDPGGGLAYGGGWSSRSADLCFRYADRVAPVLRR